MVVKGHCSHWICFFHSCLIMENVHTCTATAQLLCSQRALVTLEMLFLELLNIKLSCEETMFTLPLSQLRNYGCQRALLTLDTLYPQLTHIKLCLDNAHTCTATTQKSLQSKGIAHTGYPPSTVVVHKVMLWYPKGITHTRNASFHSKKFPQLHMKLCYDQIMFKCLP